MPHRVTEPLLDVVEVLLQAHHDGTELYGWAIAKAAKRSGPTVYGAVERLQQAGWITRRWEEQNPEPNKPRRRLYQFTAPGVLAAQELLAKRRPQALSQTSRPVPRPAFGGWLATVLGVSAR